MLLRELADQGRRRGAVQPTGYQSRAVKWEVVLTPDGSRGELRALGGPIGEELLVPDVARSGSAPKPFPAADKAGMVLGVAKKTPAGSDGVSEQVKATANGTAFAALMRACAAATGDAAVAAVCEWIDAGRPGIDGAQLAGVAEPDRVVFRLDGDTERVHERPAVVSFWGAYATSLKAKSGAPGWCLVCGHTGPLADTFPQQVRSGSLGSDQASLISVNEPAFGRQSRRQLGSSPVCLACAQASVAGLQSLLDTQWVSGGHRHTVRLADDRRLVFWVASSAADVGVLDLLTGADPTQVRDLLNAPRSGHLYAVEEATHHDLISVALSLNKSRVVVSAYHRKHLEEVRGHVQAWFADQHTAPAFPADMTALGRAGYQRLRDMETALSNPAAKTSLPKAGEALWMAALFGRVLPAALLARAVDRERTENITQRGRDSAARGDIRRRSAARIALMTLMTGRRSHPVRTPIPTRGDPPAVSPVPAPASEPASTALLLGRVFAVLESLQAEALGEVNAPVSARWLGRASTSPRSAYPAMLRNANAHLNKLRRDRPAAGYALQARLDALIAALPPDGAFPAALTLTEQADWFIGLHRQRAEAATARAAHTAARAAASDPAPAPGNLEPSDGGPSPALGLLPAEPPTTDAQPTAESPR